MRISTLFDLTGKVAIITGGAGDIGVVYADALVEAGASVVIADIDPERAQQVADELKGNAGKAIGVHHQRAPRRPLCRVRRGAGEGCGRRLRRDRHPHQQRGNHDRPPALRAVQHARRPMGPVMNVNFRGPLLCAQAVIESMTQRGGVRIINGMSAAAFMAGGI